MNKSILRSLVVASACAFAAGCAPGLGKTLRVDRFPDLPPPPEVLDPATLIPVRVTECEDARSNPVIGTINGRPLEADSPVENAFCHLLRNSLRSEGLRVTQFEGAALRGIVKEWNVKVQPGFPSTKIEAEAAVQLIAGGPEGHDRYTANYRGTYASLHPFASEELIEVNLGHALVEAVKSAMEDERLRRALALQSRDPLQERRY